MACHVSGMPDLRRSSQESRPPLSGSISTTNTLLLGPVAMPTFAFGNDFHQPVTTSRLLLAFSGHASNQGFLPSSGITDNPNRAYRMAASPMSVTYRSFQSERRGTYTPLRGIGRLNVVQKSARPDWRTIWILGGSSVGSGRRYRGWLRIE